MHEHFLDSGDTAPAATAPASGGIPAFMVAGVRSGCGKTTVTLALLAALHRRGLLVQACKAGPDFIDPAHHAALTGRPSYNLDSWMGENAGETGGLERAYAAALRHIVQEESLAPKILCVEGVMGLFDGAVSPHAAHAHEGQGSSAAVARRLNLPLLLVVDVKGMAQSVAAVVHGFLHFAQGLRFAGIVCTHVGGPRHQEMLRDALASCPIPLLGMLPRANAPVLPSRHLGLLMPHEVTLQASAMADWLEAHMDVDALLHRVKTGAKPCLPSTAPPAIRSAAPVTIAIAHDAAFCFLYPDFQAVLQELGANTVEFSPLTDNVLPPDCQALYLPGGYPELYAEQLARNTPMRAAIARFAQQGGTIYGECGGYMYMMQSITTTTGTWPMTGCLPCACSLQEHRAALGYRRVRPASANFWGDNTLEARGHEYHYASVTQSRATVTGAALPPLWEVHDAAGRPLPPEGVHMGRLAGSWVHVYPQGARALLARFIQGLQS